MVMTMRARPLAGAVIAVLASLVAVAPAGAWELITDEGTTGGYTIDDEQAPRRGANCLYESASKDLDSITVRGPRFVHGVGPSMQWIGYRFLVQRNAPPTDDEVYQTVYKSPILYARADDNENPHSWPRRTWVAPEVTSGFYRIRVVMLWFTKGSRARSAQTGKVVAQYQWYKQKWAGTFDVDSDYCGETYT
jgi:hypothetical protein